MGLLVLAVAADGSTREADDREPGRVLLPLNVEFGFPRSGVVLAAAALLVASRVLGLAALQTAAVMRVLDPAPGTCRRHRLRRCVGPGR